MSALEVASQLLFEHPGPDQFEITATFGRDVVHELVEFLLQGFSACRVGSDVPAQVFERAQCSMRAAMPEVGLGAPPSDQICSVPIALLTASRRPCAPQPKRHARVAPTSPHRSRRG
jgi:hypothetical protein